MPRTVTITLPRSGGSGGQRSVDTPAFEAALDTLVHRGARRSGGAAGAPVSLLRALQVVDTALKADRWGSFSELLEAAGGEAAIVDVLREHIDRASLCTAGLRILHAFWEKRIDVAKSTRGESAGILTPNSLRAAPPPVQELAPAHILAASATVEVLQRHCDDSSAVYAACKLLARLVAFMSEEDFRLHRTLLEAGARTALMDVLQRRSCDEKTAVHASFCLRALHSNRASAACLFAAGGVPCLTAALARFSSDKSAATEFIASLGQLCLFSSIVPSRNAVALASAIEEAAAAAAGATKAKAEPTAAPPAAAKGGAGAVEDDGDDDDNEELEMPEDVAGVLIDAGVMELLVQTMRKHAATATSNQFFTTHSTSLMMMMMADATSAETDALGGDEYGGEDEMAAGCASSLLAAGSLTAAAGAGAGPVAGAVAGAVASSAGAAAGPVACTRLQRVLSAGAIETLVAAMQQHMENHEIVLRCCSAVCSVLSPENEAVSRSTAMTTFVGAEAAPYFARVALATGARKSSSSSSERAVAPEAMLRFIAAGGVGTLAAAIRQHHSHRASSGLLVCPVLCCIILSKVMQFDLSAIADEAQLIVEACIIAIKAVSALPHKVMPALEFLCKLLCGMMQRACEAAKADMDGSDADSDFDVDVASHADVGSAAPLRPQLLASAPSNGRDGILEAATLVAGGSRPSDGPGPGRKKGRGRAAASSSAPRSGKAKRAEASASAVSAGPGPGGAGEKLLATSAQASRSKMLAVLPLLLEQAIPVLMHAAASRDKESYGTAAAIASAACQMVLIAYNPLMAEMVHRHVTADDYAITKQVFGMLRRYTAAVGGAGAGGGGEAASASDEDSSESTAKWDAIPECACVVAFALFDYDDAAQSHTVWLRRHSDGVAEAIITSMLARPDVLSLNSRGALALTSLMSTGCVAPDPGGSDSDSELASKAELSSAGESSNDSFELAPEPGPALLPPRKPSLPVEESKLEEPTLAEAALSHISEVSTGGKPHLAVAAHAAAAAGNHKSIDESKASITVSAVRRLLKAGFLRVIVTALQRHAHDSAVVRHCCYLLPIVLSTVVLGRRTQVSQLPRERTSTPVPPSLLGLGLGLGLGSAATRSTEAASCTVALAAESGAHAHQSAQAGGLDLGPGLAGEDSDRDKGAMADQHHDWEHDVSIHWQAHHLPKPHIADAAAAAGPTASQASVIDTVFAEAGTSLAELCSVAVEAVHVHYASNGVSTSGCQLLTVLADCGGLEAMFAAGADRLLALQLSLRAHQRHPDFAALACSAAAHLALFPGAAARLLAAGVGDSFVSLLREYSAFGDTALSRAMSSMSSEGVQLAADAAATLAAVHVGGRGGELQADVGAEPAEPLGPCLHLDAICAVIAHASYALEVLTRDAAAAEALFRTIDSQVGVPASGSDGGSGDSHDDGGDGDRLSLTADQLPIPSAALQACSRALLLQLNVAGFGLESVEAEELTLDAEPEGVSDTGNGVSRTGDAAALASLPSELALPVGKAEGGGPAADHDDSSDAAASGAGKACTSTEAPLSLPAGAPEGAAASSTERLAEYPVPVGLEHDSELEMRHDVAPILVSPELLANTMTSLLLLLRNAAAVKPLRGQLLAGGVHSLLAAALGAALEMGAPGTGILSEQHDDAGHHEVKSPVESLARKSPVECLSASSATAAAALTPACSASADTLPAGAPEPESLAAAAAGQDEAAATPARLSALPSRELLAEWSPAAAPAATAALAALRNLAASAGIRAALVAVGAAEVAVGALRISSAAGVISQTQTQSGHTSVALVPAQADEVASGPLTEMAFASCGLLLGLAGDADSCAALVHAGAVLAAVEALRGHVHDWRVCWAACGVLLRLCETAAAAVESTSTSHPAAEARSRLRSRLIMTTDAAAVAVDAVNAAAAAHAHMPRVVAAATAAHAALQALLEA